MRVTLPDSTPCPTGGPPYLLFAVEFDSADGTFQTYLYATSHLHAAAMLDDLKANARIAGQITEIFKP